MKKINYLLLFIAFFSFNNALHAQNMALDFNGTDDYVSCGTFDLSGDSFTYECWFKVDAFQTGSNVISNLMGFEVSSTNTALIRINNNRLELLWAEQGYSYFTVAGATTLETDVWYHVAGVFDDNGTGAATAYLFLNGVQDGYATGMTATVSANSTFYIGGSGERYLDGQMDEVRVWKGIARTQSEVRANMYKELVGDESGLFAYYKSNASSGIVLTDNSSNTNTGTLNNMEDADWFPSPAFFGPKNCILFDDVSSEYINCGTSLSGDISGTSFSIEAWIYPTDFKTNTWDNTIAANTSSANGFLFRYGGAGVLEFHIGSSNAWYGISSPDNSLELNSWQHVSATYNGSNLILYVNGIEIKSVAETHNISGSTEAFIIGESNSYADRFMTGRIDELRVWNSTRSETQLRENMNKSLTGNEDNLLAYYNFDNSPGSTLANYGVTNTPDYDGTFVNMDPANDWVSSTAFNTWLNTNSTAWSTAANWSDGVPSATDNVGIYQLSSNPTISSTADVNHLYLESGASITIEDGASFIDAGNQYIDGTVNIKKAVSKDGKWHFISIPNNNTTANTFFGDYLVPWNETLGEWQNITEPTDALVRAKGYNLKVSATDGDYTFTGIPNTGDQNIEITNTDVNTNGADNDYDGANLVGNPYPSSIDWADLDDTYGAVYYWNGSAYENWNNGTGTGDATQYIAPMQGFFVLTAADKTFSLTNANRTHSGAGAFYKSSNTLSNGVVLTASNGSYLDELYLVFDEEASEDFELERDAYKLLSSTEGLAQLYSFNDMDTKFSIDVRSEEGTIQLGFQNDKDGIYHIGLKELEGISGAFLEDIKLSIFHNLENGDYSFEWSTTDSEKRFKFHTSTTATDDLQNDILQIYAHHKTIYIQSTEMLKQASLSIVDIMGRVVFEKQINNTQSETIQLDIADGVYTLVIISELGKQSKKIILN